MKHDMHIISRMLLATRFWNPLMWIGFSGMSAILLAGANRETLVGASIAYVGALALAFITAAAIVVTFTTDE